jgi:hypothetical protein
LPSKPLAALPVWTATSCRISALIGASDEAANGPLVRHLRSS